MQKVLVYSPKITNRIQYIFDFILNEFSGLEFETTTNLQFFHASKSVKISYCQIKTADEIFLLADDFMFEEILNENPEFEKLNPVGKCFYALSRFQEYFPHSTDIHGRFPGFNHVYKIPFIDAWIIEFQNELKRRHPELQFRERKFEMIITSDVDQLWAVRNKDWYRIWGGLLKDLLKGKFDSYLKKKRILAGLEDDPFDTFDYFRKLKEKHGFRMIFFWLMADCSKYDKNISVKNPEFQAKIREISEWAEYGIHPSYASNDNPEKLGIEIKRLSTILNKKVTNSRQHYLRLRFPDTYRGLIDNHITDDYTMAYADETGFRAGTCTSFFWYDLDKEQKTNLKIHPFCAMDVSLRRYLKYSKTEAVAELKRLKSEINKVNGKMIVLVHNSNLKDDWDGWDRVLESVL